MTILRYVEIFLFDSSPRRVIVVLFAIMLFRTGIWYIPNLEHQRAIAANPFVNPIADPLGQYLYWSWLGPFLAWLVGAQGTLTFFVFYLSVAVSFMALFFRLVLARLTDQAARAAIVLFAVLPVSATALFWLGTMR